MTEMCHRRNLDGIPIERKGREIFWKHRFSRHSVCRFHMEDLISISGPITIIVDNRFTALDHAQRVHEESS